MLGTTVLIVLAFIAGAYVMYLGLHAEMGLRLGLREAKAKDVAAVKEKTSRLEAAAGVPLLVDGECRNCHKSLVAGAKFCSYCRMPVEIDARICSRCGERNQEDAKWCATCGQELPQKWYIAGTSVPALPEGYDALLLPKGYDLLPEKMQREWLKHGNPDLRETRP